jgi:hypothetical protein
LSDTRCISGEVRHNDTGFVAASNIAGNNDISTRGYGWRNWQQFIVDALNVAFREKLSGRAPENRGNGLKFVRQTVQDQGLHLTFWSGSAQAFLHEDCIAKPTPQPIHGCLAILTF